jgi:serine/threonine protein kinase
LRSLSNGAKFNESVAKKIMKNILSAANYMHNMKIIHRDLKLENMVFCQSYVCLDDLQKDIDLKIIDFGSAKII